VTLIGCRDAVAVGLFLTGRNSPVLWQEGAVQIGIPAPNFANGFHQVGGQNETT
jgi:hypothetical protein